MRKPLRQLYEALDEPRYTTYATRQDGAYYLDGERNRFPAMELLHVEGGDPMQFFALADLRDEIRVSYACWEAAALNETLDALELPDHLSDILGEGVFYLFQYHLRDTQPGPVVAEQTLNVSARERFREFEPVLRRLISLWKSEERRRT
jgi:hypothetical protein